MATVEYNVTQKLLADKYGNWDKLERLVLERLVERVVQEVKTEMKELEDIVEELEEHVEEIEIELEQSRYKLSNVSFYALRP